MPATINIWTQSNMAASGAQINGTWTYTGSIAPAPTPPPTYNGVADFTGITTAGLYEFTYTATDGTSTSTSKHYVDYNISSIRVGDSCATAYPLPSTPSVPFTIEIEDYNIGQCPGVPAPTNSGEAIPANWVNTPYSGDIWYYVSLPPKDSPYIFKVTVDGSPYTVDGVTNPAVQIFTGAPNTAPFNLVQTCADKIPKTSSAAANSQSTAASITVASNTSFDTWIRIASTTGSEGYFVATFEAIC